MPQLSWIHRSLTFLHDAARCLALVHQGQLHLDPDGGLSRSSLAVLAQQTCMKPVSSPPLNEQASSYHSLLFRVLGHAGLVGAAGQTVLLSATAYEWLDQPPEVQLHQLRQTWFMASEVGWYWLTAGSQQRHLNSRWEYITLEAVKAVVDLSTTVWTPVSDLVAALEMHGILASGNVAYNLPRVRRAMERRTQSLLQFLLQEVLPCLGLLDVQSQEDGTYLRPTPEGSSWLRVALSQRHHLTHPPDDTAVELGVPSPELRFPRLEEPPVTVSDDLSLIVHLAAPAAYTFEVAHFARLLAPARYQITQASLRQAVAWDYSVADVIFLLGRFSNGKLPPAAVAGLSDWEQEMMLITCEPGYRLRTAAPTILSALRQRKPFRSRTQPFARVYSERSRTAQGRPFGAAQGRPFASGQEAWVSRTQASDLFRYLRRLGYALTPSEVAGEGGDDDGPTPWSFRRCALPLSQLLVVLRTYQHLCHVAPGLADLGLQGLERDLDAALSPDDRAAVQRLLESHVVILNQVLKGEVDEETSRQVDEETKGQGDEGASGGRDEGTRGQGDKGTGGERGDRLARITACLRGAIETGGALYMTYVDTQAHVTRRRVHPLRLKGRWGQRYLIARCELRQDERCFRLDRIIDLEIGE